MSMGAFILGGALQGLGNGLAVQAQSRSEERRQIALEALRSANKMGEIAAARDADIETKTLDHLYGIDRDKKADERKVAGQMQVIGAQGTEDRRTNAEKAQAEARLAQFKAQIETGKDGVDHARRVQLVKLEASLADDDVRDTTQAADGQILLVTKSGLRPTGIYGPVKGPSGDDAPIGRALQGRGLAPAPAAPPARISAPTPTGAKPALPGGFSEADIAFTMKQRGLTREQVLRALNSATR